MESGDGVSGLVAAVSGLLGGCARRVMQSNQRVRLETGSVPDTWVTVYSGGMGNTFGPKGFSMGSSLQVWWSKYPRS